MLTRIIHTCIVNPSNRRCTSTRPVYGARLRSILTFVERETAVTALRIALTQRHKWLAAGRTPPSDRLLRKVSDPWAERHLNQAHSRLARAQVRHASKQVPSCSDTDSLLPLLLHTPVSRTRLAILVARLRTIFMCLL